MPPGRFVEAVDGLCERVVVAVALAAYRWLDAGFGQAFAVTNGDMLRPSVAVVFYDASYDAILETCIREVLEQEAPILDKVLVDRIARAHGFKRSGRLIRERVLELAERHYHFEPDPEPDHGHFVWPAADDPDRWNIYRVPQGEDDIRFIEELAPEEIVAMPRSIPSDDPVVDIARVFGIRRLSASANGRLFRVLGADVAL